MYKAFGFSFGSLKWMILFIAVLVLAVLAYHKLIQSSIRNHPEAAHQAVREHCRYVLGKQVNQLSRDDFSEKFQACDDFRVKSIAAAGGVLDPVVVKITLDKQDHFPLSQDVLIFKTKVINFNFLSGLYGLLKGNWEFNFYNTYSDIIFNGSI